MVLCARPPAPGRRGGGRAGREPGRSRRLEDVLDVLVLTRRDAATTEEGLSQRQGLLGRRLLTGARWLRRHRTEGLGQGPVSREPTVGEGCREASDRGALGVGVLLRREARVVRGPRCCRARGLVPVVRQQEEGGDQRRRANRDEEGPVPSRLRVPSPLPRVGRRGRELAGRTCHRRRDRSRQPDSLPGARHAPGLGRRRARRVVPARPAASRPPI